MVGGMAMERSKHDTFSSSSGFQGERKLTVRGRGFSSWPRHLGL